MWCFLTPILSARPKTDELRLLVQGGGRAEYRNPLKRPLARPSGRAPARLSEVSFKDMR